MEKMLNGWKQFLIEQVSYQGILKISPSPDNISDLEAIQAFLPEEAIRLKSYDFHVTLIHQSILKPFQKMLQDISLPDAPSISLDDEIFERREPGKKSWAVRLTNQEEMRDYIGEVMKLLGSSNTDPEPERVFHVSLANLTGNPQDSVR